MIDARQIFADLQRQAETLAKDLNAEGRVADAKDMAGRVRQRLETDPQARTLAAGAGGLLLLGLLGTKGGRNLIGGVAKTGAVAAIGALAYKAWAERRGQAPSEPSQKDLQDAGFLIETDKDPEFGLAIVHAMLASAYADGELDRQERIAIEAALIKAGAEDSDRRALMNDMPESERFDMIARGARTPTQAAELYAAAVVMAGEDAPSQSAMLSRLAQRLGLDPRDAEAIRRHAAT